MNKRKIIVVIPGYNAEGTLEDVYNNLPKDKVDQIILVDDGSADNTIEIASALGIKIIKHDRNYGYGASQKSGYREALKYGADVIVMLHSDYQYDPKLLPELIGPIEKDEADIVLGSRFLHGNPLRDGMPWWRYLGNCFLTLIENLILELNLSEYHTGYRAYSRAFLESIPFLHNSNWFIFDQEILVQGVLVNCRIVEVPISTRYTVVSSSISFLNSIIYGIETIFLMLKYFLKKKAYNGKR